MVYVTNMGTSREKRGGASIFQGFERITTSALPQKSICFRRLRNVSNCIKHFSRNSRTGESGPGWLCF